MQIPFRDSMIKFYRLFCKFSVPDGTDNEQLGCIQFVENYKER